MDAISFIKKRETRKSYTAGFKREVIKFAETYNNGKNGCWPISTPTPKVGECVRQTIMKYAIGLFTHGPALQLLALRTASDVLGSTGDPPTPGVSRDVGSRRSADRSDESSVLR